jgi:serine/threonine protein kinase
VIGKTISHYKILEKLGEGGMGVVYKAEDTKIKRTVALKFLSPELTRNPDAKKRFIREAQAASALRHHNICTIHEIDETPEGQLFISMNCYDGQTLKAKIAGGSLPVEEALGLGIQVAAGLSRAHGVMGSFWFPAGGNTRSTEQRLQTRRTTPTIALSL